MKINKIIFLLGGIGLGIIGGLCIPWCFFSDNCPQPLLAVCKHGFWDWMLRILQVVGTLLAVIVALFKEDWVAYRFKPCLLLDKEHCDLEDNVVMGHTNSYKAKILLSNVGRAKANNLKVIIDRIEYRVSVGRENVQTISAAPYELSINGGKEQVCIPTDDEIRVEWLSILQAPMPKPIQGAIPPVPPLNLMIGKRSIQSAHHNGVLEVTIKIKCDELKPQKHVIRIEWDGSWKSTKDKMNEVFSYKWL